MGSLFGKAQTKKKESAAQPKAAKKAMDYDYKKFEMKSEMMSDAMDCAMDDLDEL